MPAPPRPPVTRAQRAPGAQRDGSYRIAFGTVRHARLAPVGHAFAYPAFYVRVPVHALHAEAPQTRLFGVDRAAPLSFRSRDHGDGRTPLASWIRDRLREAGLPADGPVWLDTFPRVFGYVFKPVSFWHCHDSAGRCIAVLAEVNNTFGDRHGYLLHASGAPLRAGAELQVRKAFHVSPFARVAGRYRFRFHARVDGDGDRAFARRIARIDLDDEDGRPLLRTSLSGAEIPLDGAAARRALLRHPLFTLGVIARIHLQAFALWRHRVPFFARQAPPAEFLTRSPS